MFYKKKKKKKIRFINDVLEINYQSCCIISGPPCIHAFLHIFVVCIVLVKPILTGFLYYTNHKKLISIAGITNQHKAELSRKQKFNKSNGRKSPAGQSINLFRIVMFSLPSFTITIIINVTKGEKYTFCRSLAFVTIINPLL